MESKERMNLVLSYIDLHLQEVLSVGKIAEYVIIIPILIS